MIEIVANKTNEVLTVLKIYREGKTKSDWFNISTLIKNKIEYELEIFGVTANTKHCMRLLKGSKELEVFHLDTLDEIKAKYKLKYFYIATHVNFKPYYIFYEPQRFSLDKQTLLKHSKQLQQEGLSVESDADVIAKTIRDDYRAAGISCRVRQGRRIGGDING